MKKKRRNKPIRQLENTAAIQTVVAVIVVVATATATAASASEVAPATRAITTTATKITTVKHCLCYERVAKLF